MLPTIFLLFFFNFRIISKSILHNHSNSIGKLNYDRRKWANTFLFFFFSSCLFFSWSWVVLHLFFLFFSRLPFFFSFGVALFFFFPVLEFSFFFLGGAEFVLRVFGLFSLFLIFWGPCVFFSLSPSIAWTSRSEIDFPCSEPFLRSSSWNHGNPIVNHIMNDMPQFWHQIWLCCVAIYTNMAMCEIDM